MGLSERKTKQRLGTDPRNLSWANGKSALISRPHPQTPFERVNLKLTGKFVRQLTIRPTIPRKVWVDRQFGLWLGNIGPRPPLPHSRRAKAQFTGYRWQ